MLSDVPGSGNFGSTMNRREFLSTCTAGLIAASAMAAARNKRGIPVRKLGRTGIVVPILGFGSGSRFLMYKNEDDALGALNEAIDLGITYIDTAHTYGNGKSEEWIGRLMPRRRKEVVLATKIPGRTADQARREIELSLKRLQTDRLDVLHIHALSGEKELGPIGARGGVMEALYEAREQKITRAIGITSHAAPAALKQALEQHDFDCVQMALNAAQARMADTASGMKASPSGAESFEALALPVARRKKLGVIAMKVFGQEQLLGSASVEKLLSYALSLPVSLASVGMPRLEYVRSNAAFAGAFSPMSARERRRLSESISGTRKLAMAEFFRDHMDV